MACPILSFDLPASQQAPILKVMENLLEQMRARVLRHTDGLRLHTCVPRLAIGVSPRSGQESAGVYEPMICLVLQGAKQVTIGNRVLRYDTGSCFLAALEVPAMGCIVEASSGEPYIITSLRLDRQALIDLIADMPPEPSAGPHSSFGIAPVTPGLLQAWDGLLALLDAPADVAILGPGREREVLYRLLSGGHGPLLRQIGRKDSRLSRVRRAIDMIRDRYDESLRTESLAAVAGMSVPTFHRHFKAATGLSPLQYQKTLRLQQARRLLAGREHIAAAAVAVGYESTSQFSREYARQFGTPPSRDFSAQAGLV